MKLTTSSLAKNKKSTRKDNGNSEPMRKKHMVICKVKYDDKIDKNIDNDNVTGVSNENVRERIN